MCPKKKCLKTVVSLICAATLWNCSQEAPSTTRAFEGSAATSNVALRLEYGNIPLLDSLVLDCYGTDTLHFAHSTGEPTFSMDLFPSDSWKFKASLYANGALMQMGEIETKLDAGSSTSLAIQMHPIVGFVYIDVPLGLKNEAGIADGKMTLKSETVQYETTMRQTTESAVFKSGMLKLGISYDITLELYNGEGIAIYRLSDKFMLTEDSPVPDFSLNSLRSKVAISVQAAQERNLEITLPLKAGFRKPAAADMLITEFFSTPNKSDSSQYEFVEIYNGSIDTLDLDNCSIGITNSNAIRTLPLTATEIAPMHALVIGDALNANTPLAYINTENWYDIVSTKGSVVLWCNGETLDSLYYAPDTDSLHLNVVPSAGSKNGISTQLNIEKWKDRSDSTAWCLGKPSPGAVKFCE